MHIFNSRVVITTITLLLIMISAAGLACTGTQDGTATNNIWSGEWDTEQWGDMTLQQNGNSVTGSYEWDNGKIKGTVSGNMLKGTWSESPTYQPENDAGDFEFTLSADGNSFTGKWRYGSGGDWDGDWDGERIR